jgi:hypothetical protein
MALTVDTGDRALDDDQVLPIVAEVIGVFEALDACPADLVERQARLVGHLVGGGGIAEALTGDLEVVQVCVFPAHARLNGVVQVTQRHAGRDQETTPHRRANAGQGSLQLDDVIPRRGFPPSRVPRRMSGREYVLTAVGHS